MLKIAGTTLRLNLGCLHWSGFSFFDSLLDLSSSIRRFQCHVSSWQAVDSAKKNGGISTSYQAGLNSSTAARTGGSKTLGMPRRGVRGSFIPPIRSTNGNSAVGAVAVPRGGQSGSDGQEESTRKWWGLKSHVLMLYWLLTDGSFSGRPHPV